MNNTDQQYYGGLARRDSAMLRILGWLLAIVVIGVLASCILALIKSALTLFIIISSVGLIVAFLMLLVYNSLRARMARERHIQQKRDSLHSPD